MPEDKRNRLGGPVRAANLHPGQGQGQHLKTIKGDGHAPPVSAAKRIEALGGTAAPVDVDSEERKAAAGAFREMMTPEKRAAIFQALYDSVVVHKNVMAARVLLGYDMGLPVAATEFKNTTPVSGASVRKSVDNQLAAERKRLEAAGVDTTMIERLLSDDALFENPPATSSEA